jgi:RimJ/RimL family protein N-acetyltransferase
VQSDYKHPAVPKGAASSGAARTRLPGLWAERVRLRNLEVGDEAFLAGLDSDPVVMKYIHEGPQSYEGALEWARFQIRQALAPSAWPRLWGKWVVQLRGTTLPLGWVEVFHLPITNGDFPGVGYEFAPAYWGHGYATEAVATVVDYLLRQRKEKLVLAYARPENLPSTRLLERVGFIKAAKQVLDGGRNWCALYKISRSEWEQQPNCRNLTLGTADSEL